MDWNNDGKLDIVAGDSSGSVTVFLNVGTAQKPKLAAGVKVEADGEPIKGHRRKYVRSANGSRTLEPSPGLLSGIYSKLYVGDWNGDGLSDLLVGQDGPNNHPMLFYENVGTENSVKLAKPVPLDLPGPKMSRPSPCIVDWDGDGLQDLLCGTEQPQIYFFRNEGTNKEPKLAKGISIPIKAEGLRKCYRCRIDVVDWNEDGKLDLLMGNFYSVDRQKNGGNIWLFLAK